MKRTRPSDVVARENRIKALKLAIEVIDFRFQQLTNAHARANCLLCSAYDVDITHECEDCPVNKRNIDKPEYSCRKYIADIKELQRKLVAQQNLFRQELEILKKRGTGR